MGLKSYFKYFGRIRFLNFKTKVWPLVFWWAEYKIDAWKITWWWWGGANGLNPWLISLHFAATFGQIQFEPIRFNWSSPLASSWVCFWHRFWPDFGTGFDQMAVRFRKGSHLGNDSHPNSILFATAPIGSEKFSDSANTQVFIIIGGKEESESNQRRSSFLSASAASLETSICGNSQTHQSHFQLIQYIPTESQPRFAGKEMVSANLNWVDQKSG